MAKIDLTTQVRGILPIANGGTGTIDGSMLPQFSDNETPTGTLDGSNTIFTLDNTPNPSGSLLQFKNSSLMLQGIDYTLSQNTVTFTVPPATGSNLRAWYRWNVGVFTQTFREQMFEVDSTALEFDYLLAITLEQNLPFDKFEWSFILFEMFADSLSMSDHSRLGFGNYFTDTLAQEDAAKIGYGNQESDSLSMLDSIRFGLVGGADQFLLFDNIDAMQDSLTRIGFGLIITMEQNLPFDSVVIGIGYIFKDTMSMSDAFTVTKEFDYSFSDTMTQSDFVSRGFGYAETMTQSDAVKIGYGDACPDTMQLFDSIRYEFVGSAMLLSLNDRLSMSDALAHS
jgi:hypothetical protein